MKKSLKSLDKSKTLQLLNDAAAAYQERQKEWGGTRTFQPELRYYKKLHVFKASNVAFDPQEFLATSYGWWQFVKAINGRVIFNAYSYSPSTGQHQSKVRGLLRELGIDIDLEIHAPKGLQQPESAISYYLNNIATLQAAIDNPKSRTVKNVERLAEIKAIQAKIKQVERLVGSDLASEARAA
jgi:hypothetical protein